MICPDDVPSLSFVHSSMEGTCILAAGLVGARASDDIEDTGVGKDTPANADGAAVMKVEKH